jgi:hypothetical protein
VYFNRRKLTGSELVLRLDELETIIQSPGGNGHLEKAEALAMYIARSAPSGRIANLAMQLMSAAAELRLSGQPNGSLEKTLSELRTALRAETRSN